MIIEILGNLLENGQQYLLRICYNIAKVQSKSQTSTYCENNRKDEEKFDQEEKGY